MDATRGVAPLPGRGAGATLPEAFATAGPALARFADFNARYGAWWPTDRLVASRFPEPPGKTLERGLERLGAWAHEAAPTIRLMEKNTEARDEAHRWHDILPVLKDSRVDLGALAQAGPLAQARLLAFAPGPEPPLPASLLIRELTAGERRYAIVVGQRHGHRDRRARDRGRQGALPPHRPTGSRVTGRPTSQRRTSGSPASRRSARGSTRRWRA